MQRERSVAVRLALSLCCSLAIGISFGADPPDSKINPISGFIEVTDATWSGTSDDVRHVVNPGSDHLLQVFIVSADPRNDNGPRLAISPAGDTWIVWWREDTLSSVVVRGHNDSTGVWTSERTVSDAAENSLNPEIAHDGSRPWVAYEVHDQSATSIAVIPISDDSDPIPQHAIVGTTVYSGDVDVRINAESGDLWVTWVDSDTNVGWCEYDYATSTWSSPSNESYASDNVTAARGRIRTTVLSN